MQVAGKDHDMLVITDMFNLTCNTKARDASYQVARIPVFNQEPLSMEEALTLLCNAGEPALGFTGDKEVTLELAEAYAARGCPTMIRVFNTHGWGELLWFLVVDRLDGMIGTIGHEPEPGPPIMCGPITDYFTGEAVVITTVAPGWRGSWARLWKERDPLQ